MKNSRNPESGYTVHELFLAVIGIGSLGLVIILIYVAAHFIMKYW